MSNLKITRADKLQTPTSRTGFGERRQMFGTRTGYTERDIPLTSGILKQVAAIPVLLGAAYTGLNTLDNYDQIQVKKQVANISKSDLDIFFDTIKRSPSVLTDVLSSCKTQNSIKLIDLINDLNRNPSIIQSDFDLKDPDGYKNASDFREAYLIEKKICEKKMKKSSSSINNNEFSTMKFSKKADKVSDTYYKDAAKGLGNDAYMKEFYKEMSAEYNKKSEAKPQKRSDLMDFFYEQEHIMSQAHPNSTYVADAMGQGGLVENGVERLNTIRDIVSKKPTGNNF